MARVAHATSAAWHRNQIVAVSHPKDLDGNPRSKLNGSSNSLLVATSLAQCVLVDSAILHDDDEILSGICDEVDVVEGIAIDEQQIRKSTHFDDAEPAGVGIDEAREGHQLAVVGGGHLERFGGRIPADHHGEILPLPAGSP